MTEKCVLFLPLEIAITIKITEMLRIILYFGQYLNTIPRSVIIAYCCVSIAKTS